MTIRPYLNKTGLLFLIALCLPAPALSAPSEAPAPQAPQAAAPAPRQEAQFAPGIILGDRIITEDTVWRGEVLVEGAVTVAPQATLTVEPGSVVRFRRKDNREALLVVQGRIVAAGTRETPIRFTSSYAVPAANDWQGIMLLGSEKKNLLENCRIEGARTGMEVLFSHVTLRGVRADRSATGFRFQDALATMEGGGAGDCDTGITLSESEANFKNLNLAGNRSAVSAQRSSIYLQEASIAMNRSAFSCDDCRIKIQGGAVLDNDRGITLMECEGSIVGAKVARNGDYGISLTTSRVRVTGNQITGNVQQGVLVFDGSSVAWANSITGNGYDVYNAGKEEFRAPGNWWGAAGPKIFDNGGRGKVLTVPQLATPPAQPGD